jgi:hypothetical protein
MFYGTFPCQEKYEKNIARCAFFMGNLYLYYIRDILSLDWLEKFKWIFGSRLDLDPKICFFMGNLYLYYVRDILSLDQPEKFKEIFGSGSEDLFEFFWPIVKSGSDPHGTLNAVGVGVRNGVRYGRR